ncbi:MAG: hypothetical protein JXA54_13180 [Candidatus Heimdallarchaeota archaeon]|nr:hypothetical protein [Candidatus Heimdallarchaeota archaeon]
MVADKSLANSQKESDVSTDDNVTLGKTADSEEYCYWCHTIQNNETTLTQAELFRRGKEISEKFWTCSKEHETKIIRYFSFVDSFYIIYLFFVILVPIVLIFLSFFYWSLIFTFGIFMSLGLGLLIMPLIGNQVIINLGLRKANIIGRILGAMLILIGLTLLLTNGLGIFRPSS